MKWLDNLLAKFVGKKIGKQLDLTEGPMETSKPWWKSQTIWSDVLTIVAGVWPLLQEVLAGHGINLPAIPGYLLTLLGAAGIHGRITANKTLSS